MDLLSMWPPDTRDFGFPPQQDFELNRESPLARGLVGYWPLVEVGGGVSRDYSGFGNHGAWGSAVTATITEMGRMMLSVNSVLSSVIVPANDHLDAIGAADFSVHCWVRTTDTNRDVIVGKRDSGNGWRFYQLDADQLELQLVVGASSTSFYSSSCSLTDGALHAVGFSADRDGDVTFWFDGQACGTADISAKVGDADGSADLRISGQVSSGQNFVGEIGEVVIVNRLLSAAEVWSLYNDPWQLRQPTDRMPGVFVTGGAPPTFAGRSIVIGGGVC